MANTTFIAPTSQVIDLRIKKEIKRNPVFKNWSDGQKTYFHNSLKARCEILRDFEGMPRNDINALIEDESFWSHFDIPTENTDIGAAILNPIKNIVTDLCV